MSSHVFFVCGTPSNKRGFEWSASTGKNLPGTPEKYLDRFDPEKMESGQSYVCRTVSAGNTELSLLGIYEPIQPYDDTVNRGAFIASGVLTSAAVGLDEALYLFSTVTRLASALTSLRDQSNAFPRDFSPDKINFDFVTRQFPADIVLDTFLRNCAFVRGDGATKSEVLVNSETGLVSGGREGAPYLNSLKSGREVEKLGMLLRDCQSQFKGIERELAKTREAQRAQSSRTERADAVLGKIISDIEQTRTLLCRTAQQSSSSTPNVAHSVTQQVPKRAPAQQGPSGSVDTKLAFEQIPWSGNGGIGRSERTAVRPSQWSSEGRPSRLDQTRKRLGHSNRFSARGQSRGAFSSVDVKPWFHSVWVLGGFVALVAVVVILAALVFFLDWNGSSKMEPDSDLTARQAPEQADNNWRGGSKSVTGESREADSATSISAERRQHLGQPAYNESRP